MTAAFGQCRWWRARGWTPADVFEAFGREYAAPPSWPQAVWLTAQAWASIADTPAGTAITVGADGRRWLRRWFARKAGTMLDSC